VDSQFLQAAYVLLQRSGRPMSPKDLVDAAIREGLLSDKRTGKTPRSTMNSKLSVHIKRLGDKSAFVRTGPGLFDLRRLINEHTYQAPSRMPAQATERILVFPAAWLDRRGRFQGVIQECQQLAGRLLAEANCTYLGRMHAEQKDDYKQVLTYVLVTRRDEVLAYKRGSYNRVEDFLRGCHCIGFGGHVSSDDLNIMDSQYLGIYNCAARELSEELKLPVEDENRLVSGEGLDLIGLLNDDSSPTGRRHFAFVMRYEVSNPTHWDKIRPREQSITNLRWLKPVAPGFSLWDFEYWSQLCFREFFSQALEVQPDYRVRRRLPLRPPHVVCVLGQVGSGKSEATDVLKSEFGYAEINTGRVIADALNLAPVTEETRLSFQERAWAFIQQPNGPHALAKAINRSIQDCASPRVLVDGIRQRATLEELRRLVSPRRMGLIYIHTPADIAYRFYRKRMADECSIQDFLRVRDAPVEREVSTMLEVSDAVIFNWSGKVEYQAAIRALMAEAGA
jgi:predicted NUDIX family phosphoesterase/dephospho-CoA kinase